AGTRGTNAWTLILVATAVAVGSVRVWSNARKVAPPPRPAARGAPVPKASPPAATEGARPSAVPAEADRGPQVWALVVGIDRYQSVPHCHGAARGARAVRQWLVGTAGWGEDHVLLMDDGGAASPGDAAGPSADLLPTQKNLDWAVRNWLRPRARGDDVVVIYFAGQAVALPPRRGPSGHR